MKADDIVAEIRAEMARQRRTAAALARELRVSERGLRRRLRGEQDFTTSELEALAALLHLTVTIEREDPR